MDEFVDNTMIIRGNNLVNKGAESIEFTGERYQPEISGQIAFEHFHRYRFACAHAVGKRVLDVACGEGYGSDILSKIADSVTGLDISEATVANALSRYRGANLEFVVGNAAELPFDNASFDLVVSFETIEHHDQHEQMVLEIKRVLRPDGMLIISSPNKQHYSIETGFQNPFHVKELFREEFEKLLGSRFANVAIHGQRVVYGSLLVPEFVEGFQSIRVGGEDAGESVGLVAPLYDLAMASDRDLPPMVASVFEMKVHGLDPANFYGVHLLERVRAADARIHETLQIIDEKEFRLQAAAEERRHLEAWLAELQTHADGLERRSAELEDSLSGARANREELGAHLASRNARIIELQAELEMIKSSRSWRYTSILRRGHSGT